MRYLFKLCCIFWFSISFCFASQQLIVEPDMGRAPLLSALSNARHSISLVMYGITDSKLIHALIQAKSQGKKVRILLEPQPYKAETENIYAIKKFQAADISLHWPSSTFSLTHQKTFLLDDREVIVMTFNLTHASFSKERNFALVITDPLLVQEIKTVFDADWNHQPIPVYAPDLLWSPDNSRDKILSMIRQAKSSIEIYAENIRDYNIVGALATAARSGVNVTIITSKIPGNSPSGKLRYLARAGVHIYFSQRYFIHAKVIICDHTTALLGSINLTSPSLDHNRELSVITRDKNVVRLLDDTFQKDLTS